MSTPTDLLIAGQWKASASGARFSVSDPSTGRELVEVSNATAADAEAALTAAASAMTLWSASTPARRAALLTDVAHLLRERSRAFVQLLTVETGKPTLEAEAEVDLAVDYLRWYAGEALRILGGYASAPDGRSRIITIPRPLGPCLIITPWVFPLSLPARKIAMALAAGNTCVVKPASRAPLSTLAFVQLLVDAGLPPGAVNAIPTDVPAETLRPVMQSPRLAKLSFVGSTPVGRAVAAQAASRGLSTSIGMGGNAPFLVFSDADLEAAVRGATVAKLRNAGQMASAVNRFLVHRSIAAAFSGRLAEEFAKRQVGIGTESNVELGPLISKDARDGIHRLVLGAVSAGARLLTGGQLGFRRGWYYPPTVLADVPPDAAICGEEIFGPVAPITVFDSDQEALELANAYPPGMAAYMYTHDVDRVFRVGEQLDARLVAANRGMLGQVAEPFGGPKLSNVGREGGHEGITEYLQYRQVALADVP